MIAHKIEFINPEKGSYYGNYEDELGEYDFKDLERVGIVECWYSYSQVSYDGSGWLIGKSEDGLYVIQSLGHCSCYGPCDDVSKPSLALEQLKATETDKDIDGLILKNLIDQL